MNIYAVAKLLFALSICAISVNAENGYARPGDQIHGDMILPARNRNGILKAKRWPNGVVPYYLSESFSQAQLSALQSAMDEIQRYTCIRFVKRTSEKNYVNVQRGPGGCSAAVGVSGGSQPLNLNDKTDYNCWVHFTLVHELLHAIGLFHEQSRYDRDSYINIFWENIEGGRKNGNYQQYFPNETDTYGTSYDYYSVMHYDSWSASIDKKKFGMLPKSQYYVHIMGFADHGSETDYTKVRRMYECTGSYPRVPDDMPPCVDKRDECDFYLNDCDKKSTMIGECRKTCGYCNKGGIPPALNVDCKDRLTYCDQMKDQCGKSKDATLYCRKTCNLCDYSKCTDTHASCDYYKDQCTTADWMKTSCKKTCKLC